MKEKKVLEGTSIAGSQALSMVLKVWERVESFSESSGWIDSAHSVTAAGLLESQWVSTLVKGQWKKCNELQSFRRMTVWSVCVCVCVCVYCRYSESLFSLPVPLLKLSSGWHPSLPSALHWLYVFQHSQCCPWHHAVPSPPIPHMVIYPCLFPFNFLTISEL